MKYWDSSALIPLLFAESVSARAHEVQGDDPAIVTWWGTAIECVSALTRRERDGNLSPAALGLAIGRVRAAAKSWTEVVPSDELREQSIRLLRVHRLRAADAIQLGAAIVAAQFQPGTLDFVSFDKNQKVAADKEGFRVID